MSTATSALARAGGLAVAFSAKVVPARRGAGPVCGSLPRPASLGGRRAGRLDRLPHSRAARGANCPIERVGLPFEARETFPAATTRTSIPRSIAARASPNPVGPASYTARTRPGSFGKNPTTSAGGIRSLTARSSPVPTCRIAACVCDACTSSPNKRDTAIHGRHLPELGCRQQAHPVAQSPHISARGVDRSTAYTGGPDRPP